MVSLITVQPAWGAIAPVPAAVIVATSTLPDATPAGLLIVSEDEPPALAAEEADTSDTAAPARPAATSRHTAASPSTDAAGRSLPR